jgi:hypothetical protein
VKQSSTKPQLLLAAARELKKELSYKLWSAYSAQRTWKNTST